MVRKTRRNSAKGAAYVALMDYKCANPECISGKYCEGHHIQPLQYNGYDCYTNLICLCRKCHRGKNSNYHIHWEEYEMTLLTWKFHQELKQLGITSDEYTDRQFAQKAAKIKAKLTL